MSDQSNDRKAGHLTFFDSYQPGLKDGTYELTLTQEVSAPDVSVPALTQVFVLRGPRWSLAPSDVYAESPPNGATGDFAGVLPHVVLRKRLLPWERDIPHLGDSIPWLALLVFQPGELVGDANDSQAVIANHARTMTVAQLRASASATVRIPVLDDKTISPEEPQMNCQVITLTNDTFARIVPTARELPHLTHARQVDTAGKVLLDMKDDGLFSVVVGNRFPLAGDATQAAKAIVHLVSLEGFGDLLGGAAPVKPPQAHVQLVSLRSWSFSCLADQGQTFTGIARHLAYDANGAQRPAASLMLRLPVPPTVAPSSEANADAASVTAKQRLQDGYAALGYHAPTGEDNFAWYRGPFAPVVANAVPGAGAFESSSAATIYDPATGVFDLSLAAAWQCGRSLALSDETYASTLMRLRQTVKAQLDRMAAQRTAAPRPRREVEDAQLAALFAGGALQAIRHASTTMETLSTPARAGRVSAALRVSAAVEVLHELLHRDEVRAALTAQIESDPDAVAVANWLGRLRLLYGVPFVHLVSVARMLPAESVRFFYLDPSWIDALAAGALNIGLVSSKESAIQAALTKQLQQMAAAAALAYRANALKKAPPPPADGPCAGLLIRSSLVAGWPGLTVAGTRAGTAVPLLRADHLAPGVLFCLFNGVPDTVTLAEPHEALEFGVDDTGTIVTRVVAPPAVTDGAHVTIFDPRNPAADLPTMRAGGSRVLNVNIDPRYPTGAAPDKPVDLLGTLAGALKVGTGSIGPADLAVQMVKGPRELTFSFTPPHTRSTRS
jgi:hypothetical protein